MRLKHLVTLLVLLALSVASAPTPAQAGGIVSVCDEAHLLTAIAGGGTVTFSCIGTITLIATITIAADTTIDGSGQSVTISGNNAVRVFTVNPGTTLTLNALKITNGSAVDGGGIYNNGTLIVSNSTFDGNSANSGSGGGIYNHLGTVTVNSSTFSGNKASLGSGDIHAAGGGGIYNHFGTLTVSNSTFSGNQATPGSGGGTYSNCGGGGIYNNSGTVAVSNSTFSSNFTFSGGGGIHNNHTLNVSNSTFNSNAAFGGSGGIDNSGTLTVNESSFSNNTTAGGGGGIGNSGTLSVSSSTFDGNDGSVLGGGIANGGTLTVSNSTFTGNSATATYDGVGGGIANYSMLTVSSSTFAGNSAYGGGGSIYNHDSGGAVTTLRNTIVANSPAGANCSGTIADGSGNLTYPDTTCPGINGDPVLGPLQNNGGLTKTMALLAGSTAIDRANDIVCAAAPVNDRDQRGIIRPQGLHCDIGAYEALPRSVVSICDEAHLLAALIGGGTATFSCSGTITLTTTITIAADTTIDGGGQSVTISGNNAVRVFTVNPGATLTLNALKITNGSAVDGGGIYNNGTLIVSNSHFGGNSARSSYPGSNFGGGIYNNGPLTVSNSTFDGNSARSSYPGSNLGGGIYNNGPLTVSSSTFSSNSAYDGGGGIYNNGGALTVSNSTFVGNAAARGGGIANYSMLTVSSSTFAGNSAYGGGGSIYNHDSGGAVTTLRNTIVANSPAGANCSGTIADGSGNLAYPDTTCPGINFVPALGPLQNNGGPTKTMALLAGSTAIDRANDIVCAAAPVNNRDQRGIIRPQGLHCDIGAYEATPPRAYLPIILQ